MGAISDLADWAVSVALRHEAWGPFAEWVKSFADQGQLKSLAEFCREAPGAMEKIDRVAVQ